MPKKDYDFLVLAEMLVEAYSGTGKPRVAKNGNILNIEYAQTDHVIGKIMDDATGKWIETRRFAIRHGKKGSHIVPAEENEDG